MKLQQMIDNGYADKLIDYPYFTNFERIQIGEYLIFIYHPSKDEYVAQLIQNNDILESEEYNSHYPAFNKCLEYMKDALDASGYIDLEDCKKHPNSTQYAIEKHNYFESIAPIVYFKRLDKKDFALLIGFKKPNWIEYREGYYLGDALGIKVICKRHFMIYPEQMEECELLSGIPEECEGYELICRGSCPDDIVNAIVKLNMPVVTHNYLQSLLGMKSFLEEEISNTIYEIDEPSKIELIRSELKVIDNLWKDTLV